MKNNIPIILLSIFTLAAITGCNNEHVYEFKDGKDLPSYTLKADKMSVQIQEFAYFTRDGSRCFRVYSDQMTGAGCWDRIKGKSYEETQIITF